MISSDQNLIRRISDYERISGILWIVLAVIQICTIVGVIAGIWNIFAGRSRLKISKRIAFRDSKIPKLYEGINELIVIGLINLFLGGVIGILFVGFDFYIRDMVLTNAYLFNEGHNVDNAIKSVDGSTDTDFDQYLRNLFKLKEDGIITEEDFMRKKKEILNV